MPLTWLVWIAAGERVRGWSCTSKRERDPVHPGRKVGDEPMEGALVRVIPSF
jgi:hypothetical protein